MSIAELMQTTAYLAQKDLSQEKLSSNDPTNLLFSTNQPKQNGNIPKHIKLVLVQA
jgi:hypothetical protein